MRTIVGYRDGRAIWSENVPADYITFGRLGGRSMADATSPMAPVVRPQAARYVKPPRDYHESVMKGHATRKLRGENCK